MSTNFPTTLDTYTDKVDGTDYPQAAHINNPQDAIVALETKVGIDSSAVATSLDYLIKNTTGGHDHDGSDSKKVIATNLNVTGLTASQLLRVNSGASAIESSGKTVPTGDIVGTSDSQTLTSKTLTSPVINTQITGTAIIDEDNMASDSAVKVPTQQSVKAYIDSGTVTMTSKTLTSPVINTQVTGTAIASGAEVTTGTDNTQIVTPKALGDADVNTRLKSKIISATRDCTAATGSVSYTGVGFTPTSIVVHYQIGGTTTGGWGSSDSAKTQMTAVMGNDGKFNGSDTLLVYAIIGSGVAQSATLSTYDEDGFTLSWVKDGSPTGTLVMYFTCYK